MVDWASITGSVQHALTLDAEALPKFLQTLNDSLDSAEIERLLRLTHPHAGFLATTTNTPVEVSPPLSDGSSIGAWEVLEHIGRGGMGDVYKARRADGLYDQIVALKIMQGFNETRASLFETERQRLAMMDHIGIARIIDGGTTDDDRPFMAMDYVEGVSITEHVRATELKTSDRLILFQKVCDAIQHAHGKLVLHRDIKAENVLVSSDGMPRLIDFGISSDISSDAQNAGPLTLATAAPEQLKGEPVSVQTDIFALGVLLHEILTGERPERCADGGMRSNAGAISNKDLIAIIDKSLATDPGDRYLSVATLNEDISLFLSKRPVMARGGGWSVSASKFLRRYPVACAAAAIAIFALIGGFATSVKFASDARTEAARANDALTESQESLKRAQFYLNRTDQFHAVYSAYADALQSMFGGEADVERQTRVLKERWEEAHALRKDDPNNAAYLSYAIGRHFLFRNDYVTAIEIFEPWVEEEYGPPEILLFARQLLAIAYNSVGRKQDALPLFREVEQAFAQSYDASTPDHIASATQIALMTEATEDILKAEELLLKGLEDETIYDPVRMYFWSQTSHLRQLRGDFSGAYDASKEVVDLIDAKPLMEFSGTDTGLLKLADFELWYTQDFAEAEALANRVLASAKDVKGESRELGLAHGVLAMTKFHTGQSEYALAEIDKALSLVSRFSGDASESTLKAQIQRAEILSSLGRAEARDELLSVKSVFSDSERSPRLTARLKLAELFIIANLDEDEAAKSRLAELAPAQDLIDKSIELTFLQDQLKLRGIAPQAER